MHTRRSTSKGVVAFGSNPEASLSFPASLLHPPQSQVTRYSDSVSDRITQLDMHAQRLGEGFGIPLTSFVLNSVALPLDSNASSIALVALERLLVREERVTLERRNGRWGLFFSRAPSIVGRELPSEPVSLREAPLDIRERFLLRSEDFFREYLKLCENRLASMQRSVGAADRALALLKDLRLG